MTSRTGSLISPDMDGGLVAEIRALRADVEALKRAGFAQEGPGSPGALLSDSQAGKIKSIQSFTASDQLLVGTGAGTGTTLAVGANEAVGRAGSGSLDGIAVAGNAVLGRAGTGSLGGQAAGADSVLTREGSGSLGFSGATASQIMAMLSTGNVGFQDRTTLVQDMDILVGEAWEFDGITGSQTLTEGKMGGIMAHSGDVTITLPTPANGGAVFIVSDPVGLISASTRVRFDGAGASDQINGSTAVTAQFGLPHGLFIFVGAVSGGTAYWTFKSVI